MDLARVEIRAYPINGTHRGEGFAKLSYGYSRHIAIDRSGRRLTAGEEERGQEA
jgi:hypothetical protein